MRRQVPVRKVHRVIIRLTGHDEHGRKPKSELLTFISPGCPMMRSKDFLNSPIRRAVAGTVSQCSTNAKHRKRSGGPGSGSPRKPGLAGWLHHAGRSWLTQQAASTNAGTRQVALCVEGLHCIGYSAFLQEQEKLVVAQLVAMLCDGAPDLRVESRLSTGD